MCHPLSSPYLQSLFNSDDGAVSAEMQSVKEKQLYTPSTHDNKQCRCGRTAHAEPSPSPQLNMGESDGCLRLTVFEQPVCTLESHLASKLVELFGKAFVEADVAVNLKAESTGRAGV